MKTTTQERQRKWKAKQEAGGKKSVTIMLDAGVKDLIDKERKKTGETITAVIERAVSSLLGPVSVDESSKSDPVTSNSKLDQMKNHPEASKIYETVGRYHNSGGSIGAMITALNNLNCKTFSGNEEWSEADVKEILEVVEHNRPLYFKILHGDQ